MKLIRSVAIYATLIRRRDFILAQAPLGIFVECDLQLTACFILRIDSSFIEKRFAKFRVKGQTSISKGCDAITPMWITRSEHPGSRPRGLPAALSALDERYRQPIARQSASNGKPDHPAANNDAVRMALSMC
jgi:hypothetical protein